MTEQRRLISSAKLVAVCTLVSRITGLVRDMLLLQQFGLNWVQDAFNYGFLIPNMFRRLFGEGALSAAFVPTFTRKLEHEGRPAAWALLARTLALLVVVLIAVILAIELVILVLWFSQPEATAPLVGASGADDVVDPARARRLLLALTALMLPFMLSICVLALFSSILNCVGSFVPPALVSVLLNLIMIAGILWVAPRFGDRSEQQIFGVAVSVLVTGVAQLVFILPALRANGVQLGWNFAPRDPDVRRLLAMMAPVLLGQGVLLLSTWLDTQVAIMLTRLPGDTGGVLGTGLAYPLEEGAVSAITAAQRLYQFPLGVLVISLATVALPAFSQLAARQEWPAWTEQVRSMLRLATFEGIMAGALMVPLAVPIVRLLFEYGRFGPESTGRAAAVLAAYGLGMWAFCAQHIVLRGFYSVGDVKTPLRISVAVLPINLLLSVTLVWLPALREAAFALSAALTSSVAVIAGAVILQRRSGHPLFDRATLRAGAVMAGAGLAAAGVVALLQHFIAPPSGVSVGVGRRALDALGSLGLGMAVYLAIAAAAGLPEVQAVVGQIRKRRPRFTVARGA